MLATQLDTPVLTCDLDILEQNIHRMTDMLHSFGLRSRIHIKTHKIPEIALMQLATADEGITCQKLGEAEVMAQAGIKDILIPYNIIGREKLERLVRLCKRANITVAIDSEFTARGISEAMETAGCSVGVIVELDTGGRCGLQSPEAAVTLGELIDRLPGLRLKGLMAMPTPPNTSGFIGTTVRAFKEAGLSTEIVSGGGSVPAFTANHVEGLTEHRAGTYVYGDCSLLHAGLYTVEQCAMRVLVTVVSRPTPDRAIIDGGSKTFTNDGRQPFHYILEYPQAKIMAQSEEHGHVDVSECPIKPKLSERLTVIPNHACGTTNLHDEMVGLRKGEVEVIWPILARGKIR